MRRTRSSGLGVAPRGRRGAAAVLASLFALLGLVLMAGPAWALSGGSGAPTTGFLGQQLAGDLSAAEVDGLTVASTLAPDGLAIATYAGLVAAIYSVGASQGSNSASTLSVIDGSNQAGLEGLQQFCLAQIASNQDFPPWSSAAFGEIGGAQLYVGGSYVGPFSWPDGSGLTCDPAEVFPGLYTPQQIQAEPWQLQFCVEVAAWDGGGYWPPSVATGPVGTYSWADAAELNFLDTACPGSWLSGLPGYNPADVAGYKGVTIGGTSGAAWSTSNSECDANYFSVNGGNSGVLLVVEYDCAGPAWSAGTSPNVAGITNATLTYDIANGSVEPYFQDQGASNVSFGGIECAVDGTMSTWSTVFTPDFAPSSWDPSSGTFQLLCWYAGGYQEVLAPTGVPTTLGTSPKVAADQVSAIGAVAPTPVGESFPPVPTPTSPGQVGNVKPSNGATPDPSPCLLSGAPYACSPEPVVVPGNPETYPGNCASGCTGAATTTPSLSSTGQTARSGCDWFDPLCWLVKAFVPSQSSLAQLDTATSNGWAVSWGDSFNAVGTSLVGVVDEAGSVLGNGVQSGSASACPGGEVAPFQLSGGRWVIDVSSPVNMACWLVDSATSPAPVVSSGVWGVVRDVVTATFVLLGLVGGLGSVLRLLRSGH